MQLYETTIAKLLLQKSSTIFKACLKNHNGIFSLFVMNAAELQWLEHLSSHEKMFETGIVRANECQSLRQFRRHNRHIFSIFFLGIYFRFFNMKVCCVFSLESSRLGDSNEYTQHTIIIYKKRKSTDITPNTTLFAAIGFFVRDSRTSLK